ncbi:MAG: hypothetical protein HY726_18450 [Candidatus Rokubacteria bacterium]|nr:hypothetical protein [Candidatus Rokubacteria bacterium]
MDIYEELVLQYLTKDGHVFVSPQYSIRGDTGTEWSCPDYVALNFRARSVSVVEVSSARKPSTLQERVRTRDHQWLDRLRGQLTANGVVDESWKEYFVDVFVRRDAEPTFRQEFGLDPTVRIHVLEELGPPWTWTRSYSPDAARE